MAQKGSESHTARVAEALFMSQAFKPLVLLEVAGERIRRHGIDAPKAAKYPIILCLA